MSIGSSSSFTNALYASSTSESVAQSLAAAAAKGTAPSSAAFYKRTPKGRSLAADTHVIYDISKREEGEDQPELEVTPITHYVSDNILEHRQQIAVNQNYISYALKQGQLRILHKHSTARALAKGHLPLTGITDLRFFSDTSNFLASAGKDGQVIVWQLAEKDDEDEEKRMSCTQIAVIKFGDFDAEAGHTLQISWQPLQPTMLAACYGSHVMILNLDELKEGGGVAHVVDPPDLPNGIVDLGRPESTFCRVAFSLDGSLLAAGTAEGKVFVWDYPLVEGKSSTFDAHSNEGSGIVSWLPSSSSSLLLTGNERNQELKIWEVTDEAKHLQTVTFMTEAGPEAFFNRVVVEGTSRLVVLSNALTASLFTLHLGPEPAEGPHPGFDYLAEFRLGFPVVSLSTLTERTEDGQAGPVHVYCIQTSAIQQYHLYPELCSPPPPGEAVFSVTPAGSDLNYWLAKGGQYLPGAFGVSAVPPSPSPVPPAPSPVPSTGAPSENGMPDFQRLTAEELQERNHSGGLASSTDVSPARWPAAAETALPTAPPWLLTPTGLLNSVIAAASRTASVASSLSVDAASLASHPASSAPPVDFASPRQESIPLPDAQVAPQPAPEVHVSPAPAVTPAPAQPERDEEPVEAAATPAAGPRIPPSPGKGLKRNNKQAAVAASPIPPLPSAAAPLEPSAPAGAEPAQGMSSAEILQKMAEMQRKLQQTFTQSNKDSQRAFREESKKEAARLEANYKQEVEALRKIVAEERDALIADEHKKMKDLLTCISTSINKDLVEKIQGVVQHQASSERTALRQAVTTAVDGAISARFSRDLPVQMQAAAEKALPAALAQPLQAMFKKNFEQLLIPAFEAACKNMFEQVQATFSAGLSEYLQAANGASTATAASLSASLAGVNGLLGRSEALAEQLKSVVVDAGQLRAGSANGTMGHTVDTSPAVDPTIKLGELLQSARYQEAFETALDLANANVVNWLCNQLDPGTLFMNDPLPLSQNVILALLQQLGAGLDEEAELKLNWIKEAAVVVNPHDPVLKEHVQPILQQVLSLLQARMKACKDPKQVNECRIVMHVLNSILHQCRGR